MKTLYIYKHSYLNRDFSELMKQIVLLTRAFKIKSTVLHFVKVRFIPANIEVYVKQKAIIEMLYMCLKP